MHNDNDILRNTLESMLADAEDKGIYGIQPMLTPDDVNIILHALERCSIPKTEGKAIIDDTEHNSPYQSTVKGMLSSDYKERFIAEYQQTKIRYGGLHKMLTKADAGTLNFTPTCPLDLLREQKANMGKYLYCLEVRAEIEGIKL